MSTVRYGGTYDNEAIAPKDPDIVFVIYTGFQRIDVYIKNHLVKFLRDIPSDSFANAKKILIDTLETQLEIMREHK